MQAMWRTQVSARACGHNELVKVKGPGVWVCVHPAQPAGGFVCVCVCVCVRVHEHTCV